MKRVALHAVDYKLNLLSYGLKIKAGYDTLYIF